MKNYRATTGLLAAALLVTANLAVPSSGMAADERDSGEITKLLADAKVQAMELKTDSADMESFTRSKLSWESYADKIGMIREHINNSGKLHSKLQTVEASGSSWQQLAIRQIEPLLKELASNTELTINHLNENRSKLHFPAFKDYVKANLELATDLESLIRDFVNYGEAKETFERLGEKLETT